MGGLEGEIEGSDSEPSEDNMEEEDMNKILPGNSDKAENKIDSKEMQESAIQVNQFIDDDLQLKDKIRNLAQANSINSESPTKKRLPSKK
jgi:hypothetical protein